MESHRLSNVLGLSPNGTAGQFSKPLLSVASWLAESIFTQMLQAGNSTESARWVLAGEEYFQDSMGLHKLVAGGPVAFMQQNDYRVSWLQSARLTFTDFHKLIAALDVLLNRES